MGEGLDATVVRLNARIHNQREQIKHKDHIVREIERRANRLLDALGIDPAQSLVMRLEEGIASLRSPGSSEGE